MMPGSRYGELSLPGERPLRLTLDGANGFRAEYVDRERQQRVLVEDVSGLLEIPWRWKDDSAVEVQLVDIVERMTTVVPAIDECWRILRPDGLLRLAVPHFGLVSSEPESTVRHLFHRDSFDCFDPDLTDSTRCQFQSPFKWTVMRKDVVDGKVLVDMRPRKDVRVSESQWRLFTWQERVGRAMDDMLAVVPPGATFIVADQDEWALDRHIASRVRLPYPEQDGLYAGPPADDRHGILELERQRELGATFFVLGWPAFWWFHHYCGLRQYVESTYGLAVATDRVMVFDLRERMQDNATEMLSKTVQSRCDYSSAVAIKILDDASWTAPKPGITAGPFSFESERGSDQSIPRLGYLREATSATVIVSMASGPVHEEMLSLTAPTFQFYAALHGMDCLILPGLRLDPSRPPAWDKVILIRNLLDYYETVFWIDSDAIIRLPHRDICRELDPVCCLHLVAHEIGGSVIPNTGVWVVRRHDKALELLEKMWQSTDYVTHPWWEQAALMRLVGYDPSDVASSTCDATEYTPLVQYLGKEWNSARQDMAENPVVLHYPGEPARDRLLGLRRQLGDFLSRVARDLEGRAAERCS